MKACKKTGLYVLILTLFLMGMLTVSVRAQGEKLVWEGDVYSSGVEVFTPKLEAGEYRIVAEEAWWYNYSAYLAADAQYYTTDNSSAWDWGNYFPAPGGHSFLQIMREDVDWGPFSNGYWDPTRGHSYTIFYNLTDAAEMSFRIVDWMDGDCDNNISHIHVRVYKVVTVGGYVVDSNTLKIGAPWIIGALMLAVVVTVPIINYFRKTHCRTGQFCE